MNLQSKYYILESSDLGNWARYITFHESRKMSVRNGGDPDPLVFHPTDRDMLDRLVAYVKENESPSQPPNLND